MIFNALLLRLILLGMLLLSASPLWAKMATEHDDKIRPPREGNFIFPGSQQISPFISFGQDMIGKGKSQVYLYGDVYEGANGYLADSFVSGIYGFTDRFITYLGLPAATSYKHSKKRYSGWEDMFLQFEGAILENPTLTHEEQITLVANVVFPTGIASVDPLLNGPLYRFLLGSTFSRMYTHWYGFMSPGVILTTSHKGTKPGEQLLYQWGVGRELFTIHKDWLFATLVEFDGQYTRKSRIRGQTDVDSGGNLLLVTPSLWISSHTLIFQLGVGFFAFQNLNGEQPKDKYLLAANICFTF